MFSKNHPIILFIDRNGFSVFQDTASNIAKFNFTPDIVANLDVVNKEQFVNLIATFIQINKILPSSLAIILSDTIVYVKDLIKSQPNLGKEQENEVQNFLENVPFEEVLPKIIKTDQKNTLVSVNKDLVMTIADAFVNKGSTIEAVVPGFLFGPKANFELGLTQENIQTILDGSEILKEGNLLKDQQEVTTPELFSEQKEPAGAKSDSAGGEKKPQNLRQFILIGAFATLLVIFVVVYLNLGASQTPPGKKIKSSSVTVSVPTAPPAGGPALIQAPITALVDLKSVIIKIIQNPAGDQIANNLKSELSKIGFQDITNESSQETIPEKSSVVFSQNIPPDVRNIAVTEIRKILPDISILENQDSELTITILIGGS